MGKEISTSFAELNQYEIINHKSNVRLWLHDVVDGLIVPGLVTAENLIAGVTLGLNELYSASDHKHDDLYSVLAHNHDSDYADIAHNHDDLYSVLAHNHDSDYADIAHNHDSDYADIAHNHDSDYADIAHNHDSDYADIAHNHDSDYADIAHNHDATYPRLATVSWSGNTSSATNRDINFTPSITPKVILMLGWSTSSAILGFLGVWENMSTSLFHLRPNSNYLYAGIATNIFYEAPSAGKLPLYSQSYNLTGYNYRGIIWGGLS